MGNRDTIGRLSERLFSCGSECSLQTPRLEHRCKSRNTRGTIQILLALTLWWDFCPGWFQIRFAGSLRSGRERGFAAPMPPPKSQVAASQSSLAFTVDAWAIITLFVSYLDAPRFPLDPGQSELSEPHQTPVAPQKISD